MRFVISVLLGVLMSFMSIGFAQAAAPEAASIVKQMKDMMEPQQANQQKVTITVKAAHGEKTQWVAEKLYKPMKNGKGIVIVMLEPETMRGMTLLIRETDSKSRMWVYYAGLRRLRELSDVSAYESCFGTNFTFADLGFVDINRDYEFMGEEEHSGVRAFKVQEIPGADRYLYKQIVTWIGVKSLLPIEGDFYDSAGLWKTLLFQDVAVLDGVTTPMRVEMKEIDGSSTTINVVTLDNNVDIPDEVFDPANLYKFGSNPVWRSYKKPAEGK